MQTGSSREARDDSVALVAVVGAILCDDLHRPTRFLAARRSYPDELAGMWEFPGGKVEHGEGLRAALAREVREELSVQVDIGRAEPGPGPAGGWFTGPRHLMTVFWCRTDQSPVIGDSHDRLRWVDAASAADLPWLPGDVPVVAAVTARLASA